MGAICFDRSKLSRTERSLPADVDGAWPHAMIMFTCGTNRYREDQRSPIGGK